MYLFISTQPGPGDRYTASTEHRGRSITVVDDTAEHAALRCAARFFFGPAAGPKENAKIHIFQTIEDPAQYMARLKYGRHVQI